MAGVDPRDLQALCVELLDAAVDSLDTLPDFDPGLEGAPDRRFVSPGQPALDCCSQLTVHSASVGEANTTPGNLNVGKRNRSARINHIGLVVTITRCIQGLKEAGMEATAPEDLEATAVQTNADAWVLWNHLWNMWRSGELFTLCGEVFFDGMRALPTSGGCVGWTMTFRVALEGYEEP
jgi:hypothetical protein